MGAKVMHKKNSKRIPCARRYKVEKMVRQHNKKLRHENKKNRKRPSKPKELIVPNSCPFKESILLEAEKKREEADAEKRASNEMRKQMKMSEESKTRKRTLGDVMADVSKKQKLHEGKANLATELKSLKQTGENSLKAFYAEVKKVLESADVVIEVLDARDPLGSRCLQLEKSVIESGKRLVLLLNKLDLVPKENVEKWLKYLKREYPVVAFKASTQEQRSKLSFQPGGFGSKAGSSNSRCIGADILMSLLANYCRNKGIRTAIRVGVVGFPNVGKSSVINSLKRTRSCNVGATPGITRNVQEVELDKHIRLLDSPGVVMNKNAGDATEIALRNAIKLGNLKDPVLPVEAILRRCGKPSLMLLYNLPEFDDVSDFLRLMAKKLGKIRKGGVLDTSGAAKKVLNDWNQGFIKYYCEPPEDSDDMNRSEDDSSTSDAIVKGWAKEFNMDDIDLQQQNALRDLPKYDDVEMSSKVESFGLCDSNIFGDGDSDVETMEDDSLSAETVMKIADPQVKTASLKKGGNIDPRDSDPSLHLTAHESIIEGNQQLNRQIKKAFRNKKKKEKRTVKFSEKLASTFSSAMEIEDIK